MLVRETDAHWHIIAQHEHARLSGILAEHVGNERFAGLCRDEATIGIALHDAGWQTIDRDAPPLTPVGKPADVFECDLAVSMQAWSASSQLAADVHPYAGLLVSLHGLRLSSDAGTSSPGKPSKLPEGDLRLRFEFNKFQHAQIELQEQLRPRLGLRTDRPLRLGLSEDSVDLDEAMLASDFAWLRAMDAISLIACMDRAPFDTTPPVPLQPAGGTIRLKTRRRGERLIVGPWPFNTLAIECTIAMTRIPKRRFQTPAELAEAIRGGESERQ
ncbi:MAG TPA: DUF3891 family protein, partial [Tepidisphaeraceae bacterium]|nr:DUF3891 family protein [Tepidisphaeraceae bacterium]